MKISPFDRMVYAFAAGMALAIAGLAFLGSREGVGGAVKILSVSPVNGSTPAPTDPIRIEFGQGMNEASVQSHLVIRPAVQGRFDWVGNTVSVQLDQPMLSQQVYTVSILAGTQTAQGQSTQRPMSWSFRPRAPSVIYLDGSPGSGSHALRVAASGNGPSREIFHTPETIMDLAASPDGKTIAVSVVGSSVTSEIWLLDAVTGEKQGSVDCGQSACSNPVWSPDGRLLAYARTEPVSKNTSTLDRIWLYDLDGKRTQPVFQDNQVLGDHPIWSANSSRLAFVDQNAEGIHIVDRTTRKTFFVTTGFWASAGSLSVDGGTLAYTTLVPSKGGFTGQVWLARLGTSLVQAPLMATPDGSMDTYPVWSPDGQWIAFLRRSTGNLLASQVMLYQMSSGKLIQATGPANYADLEWNGTGQYLLIQEFPSDQRGSPQIYRYDVASAHLELVIDNGIKGSWLP